MIPKFNKWNILCEKNIKYFCNLHSQSNITHDIYDNTFHSTYINIYRNPSLNQPYLPFASKIQIFFPPVNIISQADKNLIFLAERSFAPTRVSTFQIWICWFKMYEAGDSLETWNGYQLFTGNTEHKFYFKTRKNVTVQGENVTI